MSIDLTTRYGSLMLNTPIVVGACPMTAEESVRMTLESTGAGAVVLPSLFEEQVIEWNAKLGRELSVRERGVLEAKQTKADPTYGDAEVYLAMVNRATTEHSMPVIASLNGHTVGSWVDFAGELQEAGAAAIELNIHHPPTHEHAGPREIEDAVVAATCEINASISVPLFVKLGREYTSMPHLGRRLLSGADGLVLHGRSPDSDICLDSLTLSATWGLTQPGSCQQTIGALMRVHSYCPAMPLAASGGIGSVADVIKVLLAGADVAMVTSAIYREGPDVIRTLIDGLVVFMEKHRMASIQDLQLQRPLEFATDQERTEYMKALSSRLEANDTQHGPNVMHGDRFGHPETD